MYKRWLGIFILLFFGYKLKAQNNSGFFPVAVWLQSTFNAQSYKNAGVNMYIGLWNGLDQQQLDELTNAGMKFICDQNNFALNNLSDTMIYGWIQSDEPDNAQWNSITSTYDPCIDPDTIIAIYNSLKANDPSRPVYLNLGQGVSYTNYIGRGTCSGHTEMYPDYNNGYISGCDIVSFDIYPVNNTDTTTSGHLWFVPKGIDSLRIWSSHSKPVWCWIETTQISATSPRQPTMDEVKSEVWMAIIHGATGIGYFCHSWTPTFDEYALLHDSIMLYAVTLINNQINSLAPVLNSATTNGYATANSSNAAVPIDIMTKNFNSNDYIFAAAMRPGITNAIFNVINGTTATVVNENRTISISAGQFTDTFQNNGVHIYEINSPVTIEEIALNNVRIFPNPTSSDITIQYYLLNDEYVKISFANSLGEEVILLQPIFQNSGQHSLYFKNQSADINFSPGVYYYTILIGQSKKRGKILFLQN